MLNGNKSRKSAFVIDAAVRATKKTVVIGRKVKAARRAANVATNLLKEFYA